MNEKLKEKIINLLENQDEKVLLLIYEILLRM